MIGAQKKVEEFFDQYVKRSYPKGQIIIIAGETPRYIFYLKRGRVRKYAISYSGDEIIVNQYKPLAFFEVAWAVNKKPSEYFFKTEKACEVRVAPLDDVLKFLKNNPDVMLDLLSRVYRGIDGILGRLVYLMSGNAKDRLMYEILIEAKRFGKKQSNGQIKLDVTEADMAARSGLSRETVCRELQNIKKEGFVLTAAKSIVIKDITSIENKLAKEF